MNVIGFRLMFTLSFYKFTSIKNNVQKFSNSIISKKYFPQKNSNNFEFRLIDFRVKFVWTISFKQYKLNWISNGLPTSETETNAEN